MSEARGVEAEPSPGAPDDAPDAGDGLSGRGFALAVAAATAGAAVLHLVASWPIDHPTVVFDETGYLGNARWLAGAGSGWAMPTAPRYGLGYPLVIAPVTRAFASAGAQWRAILVVNAVLLASVVPLVALVARRVLGAARGPAALAACVGAVAPAVVAAGGSAIAEDLVLPLVPASVLALHATRGRGPAAYLFGPTVALLLATHARFTGAVVLAVLVLGIGVRRGALAPVVAGANTALLVAGVALGRFGARAVERARWTHVEQLEGGPSEIRDLLTSASGLGELATTSVGQAWYLVVGSLGLSVIGIAGLVLALRRRATARTAPATGPGARPGRGMGADGAVDRLAVGYLLALGASVFVISVAFFAQNQFRADHLVYGRHNDSFTPLWLAAAVLTLVGADRRQRLRLGGLAATVVATLAVVLVVTRDPGSFGGRYSAFAIPAVFRYVGDDPDGTFWRATVVGLLGLAVVLAAVTLTRRPAVIGPILVVWAVWSGFGTVEATRTYEDEIYAGWEVPTDVRRLQPEAIAIDVRSVDATFPALSLPWHLPEVEFTTYDPAFGEQPDQDLVVARADDPERAAAGDRIALLDRSGYIPFWGAEEGLALWVRPGPEQDRLDEAGLLLPVGFPTGLPDPAREARVEITDGTAGTEVGVAPGGSVEVAVRVRHTGTGSPWPGRGAADGPAGVRVVATVLPVDEGGPVGARSGGDVPGWVVPGEAFTTTASVAAVDELLAPLPPGRYRVALGVGQEEPPWTTEAGPGASFTLLVTEG